MTDLTHRRHVATETRSPHNRVVAIVLAVFFGYWGLHRLYTGRYLSAALWFFTGGVFGLGWFFDVVMLLIGRFKDSEDRVLGPPQYQSIEQPTYRAMPVGAPKRAKTEEDLAFDELDKDPLDDKFADLERQMKSAR